MPKTKRTPRVETRLTPEDFIKFNEFCRAESKTRSQMNREAVLRLMDEKERTKNEEHDSVIEKRLRHMEERMADLLAQQAVEIATIRFLLWHDGQNQDWEKRIAEARAAAIESLRLGLSTDDQTQQRKAG